MSSRHVIVRGELHPLRDSCDLTASDAPVVLGFGYKGINELLTEKRTGVRKPLTVIAQGKADNGKALEEPACRALDLKLSRKHSIADFHTRTVFDSDGEPLVFGASPDAFYEQEDELVEIKCPEEYTDVHPQSGNPYRKQTWWQYWLQVQFQLWVCEKTKALLFVYHPTLPVRLFHVRWSQEFWDQVYFPAVEKYLRYRRSGEPFPRREAGYREDVYEWADEVC